MQSREEDGRLALFRAASIGAILAAFVLVRFPLLTKEASVRGWNGDTAIFGLMAKKIHDGRGFDVFFWGQNYMGPLTPALAAAIRKSVLDPAGAGEEGGPISLRLASMGEIGFGICLYFLGLTRLFGRVIGAAAGLWLAIGPPFFIRLSAVPKGPEMSFALGSVLFFLAAGALTRPRPFLDRPSGHFAFGLLAGLGWWMNQTTVFVLLPVAMLVLFRSAPFRGFLRVRFNRETDPPTERSSRFLRGWARFLTPVLSGVVLGYAPVWMGRLAGWYEPALGPVVPPPPSSGPLSRFVRFAGEDFWRIVGLDGLAPPRVLAAAALVVLCLLLLGYRRRLSRALRTEPPNFEGLDLVVAIAASGAAALVLRDVHPTQFRFMTPVLPAALALLLVSFAEAARLFRRRIPAVFVVLAWGGIALLTAVFLSRQARGVVQSLLEEPDPRGPLRAIAEGGYTVCHAGYDTAYTLQFLSDERVRFIPYHSPDRNRTLSAELRSIPGPQCLVTDDGVVRRWLPSDAAQEGGPARLREQKR
ncbi:MAG TPA: hypothetical protein VLJ18_05475 [Thermoanaerobaculia bacterium]|nr:hypothetical protein [Thermoanaerobaculia bacterium]